jgi:Mg-chelatase subunit ChlI
MGSDSHYLDREHSSISCPRSEWAIWSVEMVEECWVNCLRLLHRVFQISARFRAMWEKVWINLRNLKVHKSRFYSALQYGSVVYEILDSLAANLFLMLSRPSLTVVQLEEAMAACSVDAKSPAFITLYNQLEKEQERRMHQRPLVLDTSDSGENPTKKQRQEKEKEKEKDKKKKQGKDKKKSTSDGLGKRGEGPCFQFLSQTGCDRSSCHFLHEDMTNVPADKKSRVREMMTTRGMVIDESKF